MSKSVKRKVAYAIVMSSHFWNQMSLAIKIVEPLVKLLHVFTERKGPPWVLSRVVY